MTIWYKVETKLPEEYRDVLVCYFSTKGIRAYTVAYRTLHNGWWISDFQGVTIDVPAIPVTAWAEIPKCNVKGAP